MVQARLIGGVLPLEDYELLEALEDRLDLEFIPVFIILTQFFFAILLPKYYKYYSLVAQVTLLGEVLTIVRRSKYGASSCETQELYDDAEVRTLSLGKGSMVQRVT